MADLLSFIEIFSVLYCLQDFYRIYKISYSTGVLQETETAYTFVFVSTCI